MALSNFLKRNNYCHIQFFCRYIDIPPVLLYLTCSCTVGYVAEGGGGKITG